MRWDDLFRDLEAQLAAAGAAEMEAEVADRTRREAAQLTLLDRLRAATGRRVAVRVHGLGLVEGLLAEVGSQWLLLDEGAGREIVLPLTAVLSLSGLSAWTDVPGSAGQVFVRLGLGSALRAIARDRAPVSTWLVDGSVVSGTIDRVGGDFVEVSTHAAGEARRREDVTSVRTLPFVALAAVRSGG